MTTATLVMMTVLSAANPQVLVVPYQVVDVEQGDVDRLAAALRKEVGKHKWDATDPATAAKQVKSAALCGEDAGCLATLGTRTGAQWVIAFSVGRVGKNVIVSALLVESSSGQQRSTSSEKLVTIPEDMTDLATDLLNPLFKDVPGSVALTPKEPLDTPKLVARPKSSLGPAAAGVLIGSGVIAVGGVILSVVAGNNYAAMEDNPARPAGAEDAQRGLNIAADVTVGVAIAAAATGLILLIADAASSPKPVEENAE